MLIPTAENSNEVCGMSISKIHPTNYSNYPSYTSRKMYSQRMSWLESDIDSSSTFAAAEREKHQVLERTGGLPRVKPNGGAFQEEEPSRVPPRRPTLTSPLTTS